MKKHQRKCTAFDYDKIREEARKPVKMRGKVVESPSGKMVVPRHYAIDDELVIHLKAVQKQTGVFQNPYKRNGIAKALVQALIDFGTDKAHSFVIVKNRMKELMLQMSSHDEMNAWETFEGKSPRNIYTGKDLNGRIIQNIVMYQRIRGDHPYGEKLRQLGACLDLLKGKDGMPEVRLTTTFASYADVLPVNQLKVKGLKNVEK